MFQSQDNICKLTGKYEVFCDLFLNISHFNPAVAGIERGQFYQ